MKKNLILIVMFQVYKKVVKNCVILSEAKNLSTKISFYNHNFFLKFKLLILIFFVVINFTALFGITNIISIGDEWKYFKGTTYPQSTWMNKDYDDSSWIQGKSGFGYNDNDDITVLNDMRNHYITLYVRKKFIISNTNSIKYLYLNIDYDDGFIAYLNGKEILRKNITGSPTNTLSADGTHNASISCKTNRSYENLYNPSPALDIFDISSYKTNLIEATNILAIEVHNSSIGDSDLTLIPELVADSSPVPFIITGPYLQSISSNMQIIDWETYVDSDSRVDYGTTTNLGSSKSDSFMCTHHSITLQNLLSDTKYYYKVKSGNRESRIYYFYTGKVSGNFSFILYGDSRLQTKKHYYVVTNFKNENFDFILNGGDIVTTGTVYEQWRKQFFIPAKNIFHYKPIFISIGNHEDNASYYYDYFSFPNNERWYNFKYCNSEFFILDSNTSFNPGSEQYTWLTNKLSNSSSKYKFVLMHHPAYTSGSHANDTTVLNVQNYLVPVFEKYNVTMVFNAHDHLYEHSVKSNIVYIVSGGGGAYLSSVNQNSNQYQVYAESIYHYVLFNVSDSNIKVDVKDNTGNIIESFNYYKQNLPPVGKAGVNTTNRKSTKVILDGSSSYDPNGDDIYYSWTQLSGLSVVLSNSNTPQPYYWAPSTPTTNVFRLIVSDGQTNSLPDYVTNFIVTNNQTPIAEAGNNQTVYTGSIVVLNGSLSYDPDGDSISYYWKQIDGNSVILSNYNSPITSFTANYVTNYSFQLCVTDSFNAGSSPDIVNITAKAMLVQSPQWHYVDNTGTGNTLHLVWKPNTEIDLGGYKVYYGTTTGNYPNVLDVGNITNYNLTGLQDYTTYYIVITAYLTNKVESGYSEEKTGTPTSGTSGFAGEFVVSTNTIALWHFDEKTGNYAYCDTNVKDYNIYTLILSNAANIMFKSNNLSWMKTEYGSCLYLNGDAKAVMSNVCGVTDNYPMTIEGWTYIPDSNLGTGDYYVLDNDSSTAWKIRANHHIQGKELRGKIFNRAMAPADHYGAAAWHYFAITWDPNEGANGTARFYFDFSLVSIYTANTGDGRMNDVRWSVGNDSDLGNYFPGYIDEIRITKAKLPIIYNIAPVADAGNDITAITNSLVELNGNNSYDENSDELKFYWEQIAGVSVALSSYTDAVVSFTTSQTGRYEFQLRVNDGKMWSGYDTVVVSITTQTQNSVVNTNTNHIPVADAGEDREVSLSPYNDTIVYLDGSKSYDADNDTLTYFWQCLSEYNLHWIKQNRKVAEFEPREIGEYLFKLIVSDGKTNSSDIVKINVVASIPDKNNIQQSFPNPFTDICKIRYNISAAGNVKIFIYNMYGDMIKELLNSYKGVGYYEIVWDGKDKNGNSVGKGVYLYQLVIDNKVIETKKMVKE